jgi:hypothetical protein
MESESKEAALDDLITSVLFTEHGGGTVTDHSEASASTETVQFCILNIAPHDTGM